MRCPKSRFPIRIIVFDELELIIFVSQGLTLSTASLVVLISIHVMFQVPIMQQSPHLFTRHDALSEDNLIQARRRTNLGTIRIYEAAMLYRRQSVPRQFVCLQITALVPTSRQRPGAARPTEAETPVLGFLERISELFQAQNLYRV